MYFDATPLNVITLLLIAFGLYVLYYLSKKKLDSNLPLVFFVLVFAFTRYAERPLDSYLFGAGSILALLLRFEFLDSRLTALVLMLEMLAITAIAFNLASAAFA